MAKGHKSLATGILTLDPLELYTVPDGRRAIIRWVSFYNADAGSVSASLYVRRKAEAVHVWRETITTLDAQRAVSGADELALSEGDALLGDASVTDVIEYFVSGLEEWDGDQ